MALYSRWDALIVPRSREVEVWVEVENLATVFGKWDPLHYVFFSIHLRSGPALFVFRTHSGADPTGFAPTA
jgi:hypothetical protein